MIELERKCKNCTYYPCYKITCGTLCDQHKFEHEVIIKKVEQRTCTEKEQETCDVEKRGCERVLLLWGA